MSTKSKNPIPEGMYNVTPEMYFNGNCRQAIDVYKRHSTPLLPAYMMRLMARAYGMP